jgi:hypothetical protein
VLAKDPELLKYEAALLIVHLCIGDRLGYRIGAESWGLEPDAADVEIFLEAIELQEVGEFECADISALCTYFFLEIGEHAFQVPLRALGIALQLDLYPSRSQLPFWPKLISNDWLQQLDKIRHRNSECGYLASSPGTGGITR